MASGGGVREVGQRGRYLLLMCYLQIHRIRRGSQIRIGDQIHHIPDLRTLEKADIDMVPLGAEPVRRSGPSWARLCGIAWRPTPPGLLKNLKVVIARPASGGSWRSRLYYELVDTVFHVKGFRLGLKGFWVVRMACIIMRSFLMQATRATFFGFPFANSDWYLALSTGL